MKLPKELTTVTPLSKTLALLLFITLPIIAFFFGVKYQEVISPTSSVSITNPTISPTQTVIPTIKQENSKIDLNNLQVPCRIERTCGNLIGIDCNSAADGPYYYVNKNSSKIIAYCGGYCRGKACNDCPPKAWTCATY